MGSAVHHEPPGKIYKSFCRLRAAFSVASLFPDIHRGANGQRSPRRRHLCGSTCVDLSVATNIFSLGSKREVDAQCPVRNKIGKKSRLPCNRSHAMHSMPMFIHAIPCMRAGQTPFCAAWYAGRCKAASLPGPRCRARTRCNI